MPAGSAGCAGHPRRKLPRGTGACALRELSALMAAQVGQGGHDAGWAARRLAAFLPRSGPMVPP